MDMTPRINTTVVESEDLVELCCGSLWGCPGCRQLWKVSVACDYCYYRNYTCSAVYPHGGAHTLGVIWRPTYSWRDRRRYRKAQR